MPELPEYVFDLIMLEEGLRVARWSWSDYVAGLLQRAPTILGR